MLRKIKDNFIIVTRRFFYGYEPEDLWCTVIIIAIALFMYAAYGVNPNDPA